MKNIVTSLFPELKRKRHSWLENAVPVDSFPHEVYKISKCKKCGILRIHALVGNTYSKKYALGDRVTDEMPVCEPKSENKQIDINHGTND